jgi:solute carrier family 50 (sugar transporter)
MDMSTIILEYICPGAGLILANIMFAAPLQDLQHAVRHGEMGHLNPTPWAFMLGNCFGWVLYGILIDNLWVYFANAPGLLISVWLNLGAVKLLYQKHHSTAMRASLIQYLQDHPQQEQQEQEHEGYPFSEAFEQPVVQDEAEDDNEAVTTKTTMDIPITTTNTPNTTTPTCNGSPTTTTTTTTTSGIIIPWAKIVWQVTSQTTPAPTPHERLVMIVTTIWMAVASLVGWIGSTNLLQTHWKDDNNNNEDADDDDDPSSSSNISRSLVGYMVNFNLVFFYGAPLSTIWTVLQQRHSTSIHRPTLITNTLNASFWLAYGLAVKDAFIFIPNGLGAVLGAIQVLLLLIFPRKSTTTATTTISAKSDNHRPQDNMLDETSINNIANGEDRDSATEIENGYDRWRSCSMRPAEKAATTTRIPGEQSPPVQPVEECDGNVDNNTNNTNHL